MTLSEGFVNAAKEKAREYGYELAAIWTSDDDCERLFDVPNYSQDMAILRFDNPEVGSWLMPVHAFADDIGLARALVEVGLGKGRQPNNG